MGPLAGYRVIELAGIGPVPMCAMLLADMGATVLRLDRPAASGLGIETEARFELLNRGRPSLAVDLKRPEGAALALDLAASADALIEGFRPGTMERLGLGPAPCLARNPRLVYGRMTGWGQEGPLAGIAGHDLDYIALTGVLDAIGREGAPPTPPLNLVADFGGGALYLAFGLVSALLEAQRSGAGQVVDAAMVDGAASLMTLFHGLAAAGRHGAPRGENLLDSGAPWYEVYQCADGRWLAVAAVEARFRSALYAGLGLDEAALPDQDDPAHWPAIKRLIAGRIATKSQREWCAQLDGSDACIAPVLTLAEAPEHPHHRARGTYIEIDGLVQPAPAPRFSRTRPEPPGPPLAAGEGGEAALADWGIPEERIAELRAAGVIGRARHA